MKTINPFLIGLVASFLGSMIPGMLNSSVVQIYVSEGKKAVYKFIIGVLVIVGIQTFVALYFAKLIDKSAYLTEIINEIGLVTFFILSIYFFTKKKPTQNKKSEIRRTRKNNRFFYGVLLATLNVFPILIYVFLGVTLNNADIIDNGNLHRSILTLGVLIGTFYAFRFYMYLFRNSNPETHYIMKRINPIIGSITLIVAIVNAWKVFYL